VVKRGEALLSLDEAANRIGNLRGFEFLSELRVIGMPEPAQQISIFGDEGEPPVEEQDDSRQLDEDRCSWDADHSGFIKDFDIFFYGGVGALRGRAEFFDFLVATGPSWNGVDQSGVVIDSHMLHKSGKLPHKVQS
jgi:hypothetical protein